MIYGIVLAAGLGRRIGTPKALLSFGNETFYERAVGSVRDAGLKVIAVINPVVEARLPTPGPHEQRIVNADSDHASGMFGSVRLSVRTAMTLGASGAVLLPVDHPCVTSSDIRRVSEEIERGAPVVVANHLGRRGHPLGIGGLVMKEIMSELSLSSLRDVLRRDPSRVVDVPVGEGAVLGVNTREDLERALESYFSVN